MCGKGAVRPAVVIGVGVIALSLLVAGVVLSGPARVEQPIPFNHRLHTEEIGAECTDCHLYAERGIRATIPGIGVCGDCHFEEPMTDSAAEAWLLERVEAEDAIAWQKLHRVADHVFFSHRRHTAVAGLECETCHGPMGSRTTPPSYPLREITMDGCMACHRESGVSNDCIACHV